MKNISVAICGGHKSIFFSDFSVSAFTYLRLHLHAHRLCRKPSVLCSCLHDTWGQGVGGWCFSTLHSFGVIEIPASTWVSFPLLFFLNAILFFSAVFLENNFSGCKQLRCSAEILAAGKTEPNQPALQPPMAAVPRFTLGHSAHSPAVCSHTVGPGTFRGFSTFCFWGNIGLTSRRAALERPTFLIWQQERLYASHHYT